MVETERKQTMFLALPRKLVTPAYLLATVVAVLAIVWAESEIWQGVKQLRQRADAISSEVFHLSHTLEARLRELNDDASRHDSSPALANWARVETEQQFFRSLLRQHHDKPATPEQHKLLTEFEREFEGYWRLLAEREATGSASHGTESWRAEWDRRFKVLLKLLEQLGAAEKSALADFLSQTRESMDQLFRKLIFSSAVLLTMGAALAGLVYQGFIAPLRIRLRQTHAMLERREKLTSLGVLAAGVAHEIRNPLTSIKARLFTQQSLLEKDSEAWEDNVFITEEISRLEKIVRDFLAFARPSEPLMVRLRTTQPFRDLDGLVRAGLAKSNITLKQEFLADPDISADPNQLKQVLLNLVQNSAESIGRDGTITLRTRTETRRRLHRPKRVAILEVEDTGAGIPPEVRKRLFDPFFTTKPSGTGLGLSIAARIIEKHGGALEYQCEPPHGTVFRVVLPVASNHEPDKNSTRRG